MRCETLIYDVLYDFSSLVLSKRDSSVMLTQGVKLNNHDQILMIPFQVCHQLGRLGCVCIFSASEKLRDLSKARV